MLTLKEIKHVRLEQGYLALSREWLERLIRKEPKHFEALLVYVYHLMHFCLFKEAEQIVGRAEPLATSSRRRRFFLETKADLSIAAGDLELGIEAYLKSHLTDPTRPAPLIVIGESHLILENREIAMEYGERALACQNPEEKENAWFLLALCNSQNKEYLKAMHAYLEILKIFPDDRHARSSFIDAEAALQVRTKSFSKIKIDQVERAEDSAQTCLCRELCETFLVSEPNHPRVQISYFQQLLELNLFSEALTALHRLPKSFEKLWSVQVKWAEYHKKKKQFNLEKEAYSRACSLAPTLSAPINLAASAAFNRGDHSEAIRLAKHASEVDPKDEEAFYNLGGYLLTQRRYAEARPCYLHALKIDPANPRYKTRLDDIERTLTLIDEEVVSFGIQ